MSELPNNQLPNGRAPGDQVPSDEVIVRCGDLENLAVLYASDELESTVRAAVETHAAQCAACASIMLREARLQQEIAAFDQPADSLDLSGLLLAQCRSQLAEAIDDQQARVNQPGWRAVFSPLAWWTVLRDTLVYHPAMSMAALVVVGFLAGVAGQRMRAIPVVVVPAQRVMTASASPTAASPATPVSSPGAGSKVTEQQLQSAGNANIAWVTPSGSRTPTVQVQLMSRAPVTNIIGAPDDADVQRALRYVLANGQRFDANARMETLDVLRTRCADPDVRHVVCNAALSDGDPVVRSKALDSLQGFEQDPAVQQTMIEALQNDDSSAVRAEAMNLLLNVFHAEFESGVADPKILGVFRDRVKNDPNGYIRAQSAAALRELNNGR